MAGIPVNGLPSGFDRATGGINGGTPEIPGSIGLNYAGGNTVGPAGYVPIFEEYSDSPEVEIGEQATVVHKFHCDYYTGQLIINTYNRGVIQTDSAGNVTRVLSTKLTPIPKTGTRECNVTVTSEGLSFGNPPDEFNVQSVDLNPAVEKHPRYSALTYGERLIVGQAETVGNGPNYAQQWKNLIMNFSSSIDQAQNNQGQALELLYKKQRGEDSFYFSGYKIVWSQYFWLPPTLNPGCYIEDPVSEGGLPAAFWSTDGTGNLQTSIFAQTEAYNQNMFPTNLVTNQFPFGLSWLRQADTIDLQRTWYKITRSWIGANLGQWDAQFYSSFIQPLQTDPAQGGFAL